MKYINITNEPLFNSLLELQIDDKSIDLHNDFDIDSIIYQSEKKTFIIMLKSLTLNKVEIVFDEVIINEISFIAMEDTIDNLYRGRFEYNGELYENFENKVCFYIHLVNGSIINLLSKSVKIVIT